MITPVIQSPIWTQRFTALRLKRQTVRFEDLGREIPCCECKEWLPADNEFFNLCKSKPTGLNSQCRACYNVRFDKCLKIHGF